jgi:hypothetical protein
LKLVLIASTTFAKDARSPESTYTEEIYVTYSNIAQLHSYRQNSTNATKVTNTTGYTVITLQNSGQLQQHKITNKCSRALQASFIALIKLPWHVSASKYHLQGLTRSS